MSNFIEFSDNNLQRDENEEEKDNLRFDTIESIKRVNESVVIPDYNIKKERIETINLSLFDEIGKNTNDNTNNFNHKYINNNIQSFDENINQSILSFQDLPLNNKSDNNYKNMNKDDKNIKQNNLSNKNKFNNNELNKTIDTFYFEVEDAGEKKDM